MSVLSPPVPKQFFFFSGRPRSLGPSILGYVNRIFHPRLVRRFRAAAIFCQRPNGIVDHVGYFCFCWCEPLPRPPRRPRPPPWPRVALAGPG